MRSSDDADELAALARRRIAQLEAELDQWRGALARARRPVMAPGVRSSETRAISRVIDVVAARYRVSPVEILGPARTADVTAARHVAMRLCRELTGKSYPELGRAFNRDHSTVMHALAVTEGYALGDLRRELAEVGS